MWITNLHQTFGLDEESTGSWRLRLQQQHHPQGPVINLLLILPIVAALPSGHILAMASLIRWKSSTNITAQRQYWRLPKKELQTFAIYVAIVRPRGPVCTENLNPDIVVMKSAKQGV